MGHRPEEPGALALMAEILAKIATDEQVDGALTRCARECRYPVRLSDILQRIRGLEISQPEAEARKAWELLTSFAQKWVQSDTEGNYVVSRGVRSSEPPTLSDRILDTVRRTGGWKVYKCMTDDDFPFVQKRFFDEYAAWTAVEQVVLERLLTEIPQLQLVAKPMGLPKTEMQPKPAGQRVVLKKIPQPLTEVQIRDRREVLRQQAARLKGQAGNVPRNPSSQAP